MTFPTAKAILDREFAEEGWDGYEIQLLGGEPLLNFDLIKKMAEYIFEICGRTDVRLFIVTNGTVLTPEMKSWLQARKERIVCGLSIDGIREAHNKSRSNSFDMIDLDFFAKTWPTQVCRMTLHSSNIEHFAQGVIFLTEQGFNVAAAFAQGGTCWVCDEVFTIFQNELIKLREYYIQHPEKKLVDMLDVNFGALAVPMRNRDRRWCGAGGTLSSYDLSGRRYPCHTFAPVSIGKRAEEYVEKTVESLNYRTDEICRDCAFLALCPTCMGMNISDRGEAGKRDRTMCRMHKARFLAASQLAFLRRYANRSDSKLSIDEFRELTGIAKVQRVFGVEITLPEGI